MYRVLIIDDEPMARERIRVLLNEEPDIEIAGECRNGIEALDSIQTLKPDLVFLDIQMPGLNGFEVLSRLERNSWPEIIFVTAYDQYTLQAFSSHALDYLLKPFDDERFKEALNYARSRMQPQVPAAQEPTGHDPVLRFIREMARRDDYIKRIQVKVNHRILLIDVNDIASIEADGCYVRICVEDANYLLRQSLTSLEQKLDSRQFARIHRSTIINLNALKEIQHWSPHEWIAILKNGKKYMVSRNYREKLKDIL